MIYKDAVTQSAALANSLASQGYQIAPIPGTPMELLWQSLPNGLHILAQAEPGAEQSNLSGFSAAVERLSSGTAAALSDHDATASQLVQDISPKLNQAIRYVRNVVEPCVANSIAKLNTWLETNAPKTAAELFTVEVKELPAPLLNPGLSQELSQYANQHPSTPNYAALFGPREAAALRTQLLSGDAALDVSVGAWASTIPVLQLAVYWESFFQRGGPATPQVQVLTADECRGLPTFAKIDAGLFIYLTAKALEAAVPEEVTGITLPKYQIQLADLKNFGGQLVAEGLEAVQTHLATKRVVLQLAPDQHRIAVFGPNYREWLEARNAPETLFGLIFSNEPIVHADALSAAAERLQNLWRFHAALHESSSVVRLVGELKAYLRLLFDEMLRTLEGEEQAFADSHPEYRQVALKTAFRLIDELTERDIAGPQLAEFMRKLICTARFYYTAAEDILGGIGQLRTQQPQLAPREAATLAVAHYVARFLASQLQVLKVSQ